jgi:hypothetical protein
MLSPVSPPGKVCSHVTSFNLRMLTMRKEAIQDKEFSQFKDLPPELRESIWRQAYRDAVYRITNIFRIVDQNSGRPLLKRKPDQISHLILASREARAIGCENIQLWTMGDLKAKIYFNPRVETLWFAGLSSAHRDLSIGPFQSQISSLAFPLESWTTGQKHILKSILLGFHNLQRLSFIIPSHVGELDRALDLAIVPPPPPAIALINIKTLCRALQLNVEEITWKRVQDLIQLDLHLPSVEVEIISLVRIEREEHWRAHYDHQLCNIEDRLSSMLAMTELCNGRCLSCGEREE